MFTAGLQEKESLKSAPYPTSIDTELPASACAFIPTLLPVSTSDVIFIGIFVVLVTVVLIVI